MKPYSGSVVRNSNVFPYEPNAGDRSAELFSDSIRLVEVFGVTAFGLKLAKIVRAKSAGWSEEGDVIADLEAVGALTASQSRSRVVDVNQICNHACLPFPRSQCAIARRRLPQTDWNFIGGGKKRRLRTYIVAGIWNHPLMWRRWGSNHSGAVWIQMVWIIPEKLKKRVSHAHFLISLSLTRANVKQRWE
jgi:hypothetical protein